MARKFRERFKTLNDVFDQFTIRNLFVLSSRNHFEEDSLSPLAIGKEANLFTARSNNGKSVVVKIYRLETCDFNRMYDYLAVDPRFAHLRRRRRGTVFAWCRREFRNLLAARRAGVACPQPSAFFHNILLMEQIGKGQPARKIKDDIPANPDGFLAEIISQTRLLYKAGYVHSDMSKFNILNCKQHPVLIDFSQMVPLKSAAALDYLKRDLKNVSGFFIRLGVEIDADALLEEIISARIANAGDVYYQPLKKEKGPQAET